VVSAHHSPIFEPGGFAFDPRWFLPPLDVTALPRRAIFGALPAGPARAVTRPIPEPETPWDVFWGSIGTGLKGMGITVGRMVIEPGTLLWDVGGYTTGVFNPYYNHRPISMSGQAYDGVQFGSVDQLKVAANAQANIWTLGAHGQVQGIREYAETGDPAAWRDAAAGQLMATVGARSAVRGSQLRAQARLQRQMAAMERWAEQQDMAAIGAGEHRVNPSGCNTNCVAAAVAGDATLAGRPASALPMYGGGGMFIRANVPDMRPYAMPLSIRGHLQLTDIMARSGDGARAVVFGKWPGSQEGHIINVINRQGRVHYIDFQLGRIVTGDVLNRMVNLYFIRTN
jgi:hypothetical protein